MPLVLVHNDIVANPEHAWDDVEGVHYHYPSKYQRLVKPGEPFVYYRGVHRVGGKRGPAEYVGAGLIGEIWEDPKPRKSGGRAWYCAIDDYRRFRLPVPAKKDGATLEQIRPNLWRDGVRSLPLETYRHIIAVADEALASAEVGPATLTIEASEQLIIPRTWTGRGAASARRNSNQRRSKQSKEVGDAAEQIALKFIEQSFANHSSRIHRAGLGETPGWDIDYIDEFGVLQRVEVKGTVGAAFASVDITANELESAKRHKENYWLYLVARCMSDRPQVQAIRNPADYLESGKWQAKAEVFSLQFLN